MNKNTLAGIAVVVAILAAVLVSSLWVQGNEADALPVQDPVVVTEAPENTGSGPVELDAGVTIVDENAVVEGEGETDLDSSVTIE